MHRPKRTGEAGAHHTPEAPQIMSTTDITTVDEVEVTTDEVAVGSDDTMPPEVVDAEVVSDEVEETAPTSAKRKSRTKKGTKDVAAPAPVAEKSSWTRATAKKKTADIKSGVEKAAALFIEAYQARAWLALDYQSWADYLNGELGEYRPRLVKADRLELVASMKQSKMAQGAMADVLGVDQKTISNDLRELRGAGADLPSSSVGQDGVERAEGERGGAGTRRKPLVDRVSKVFDALDKAFGDLTELGVEEDWDESVAAIAARHRPDVARYVAQLNDLAVQFNEAPDFEG